MLSITSPQNERIKRAAKLHTRKGRREQSRIIIHGGWEITLACAKEIAFEEVFLPQGWLESIAEDDDRLGAATVIEKIASSTDTIVAEVHPKAFEKIAFGNRTHEPVATAATPEASLSKIAAALPDDFLLGVIEGVEKPGNIGAMLRTADSAGVDALVLCDGGTDLYNPNAIRASRGAIFCVPVCAAPTAEVIQWLLKTNTQTVTTVVATDNLWSSVDYTQSTAVVLGAEATGLTAQWRRPEFTPVSLPMGGLSNSLNVSVTAGVFFYESARQRIAQGTYYPQQAEGFPGCGAARNNGD